MTQDGVFDFGRILYVDVPQIDLARLVAQGDQRLGQVHAEADVPDIAVFKVECVDDCHLRVTQNDQI